MTKSFKIILLVCTFVIALPIGLFLIYFGDRVVSKDIPDWVNFAEYFGGIVNTIISLCSLLVLVYVTIQITSLQNKSLFIFQKRIEAYDELGNYIYQLNLVPDRLAKSQAWLTLKIGNLGEKMKAGRVQELPENFDELFESDLKDMQSHINFFKEYELFLFTFQVRYSHLFKFDFESEEYKKLVSKSKSICEQIESYFEGCVKGEVVVKHLDSASSLTKEHREDLAEFINLIRAEIELKHK